jgi:hypothetical protein
MSKKSIQLTTDQILAVEEWKKAKESETAWADYRRSLAEALTEKLGPQFNEVVEALEPTKLTTEVQLVGEGGEHVMNVKLGRELKATPAGSLTFVTHYPHLINVAMKVDYKPVAGVILPMFLGNDAVAQELQGFVSLKPITPAYTAV